ncbi:MAG: hypothetical protein WC588_02430 [Candidatus Micrarchaeia archaeon]
MDWQKALAGRAILLLPIAVCAFVVIDSQDRFLRLLGLLGLVVFAQAREWMLLSTAKKAKG